MARKRKRNVVVSKKPKIRKARIYKTSSGYTIEVNIDSDKELERVVSYRRRKGRGYVANVTGLGKRKKRKKK